MNVASMALTLVPKKDEATVSRTLEMVEALPANNLALKPFVFNALKPSNTIEMYHQKWC